MIPTVQIRKLSEVQPEDGTFPGYTLTKVSFQPSWSELVLPLWSSLASVVLQRHPVGVQKRSVELN